MKQTNDPVKLKGYRTPATPTNAGKVITPGRPYNRHDRRTDNAKARHSLRRPDTRLAIIIADWLTPAGAGPMELEPTFSETLRRMPLVGFPNRSADADERKRMRNERKRARRAT